MNTCVSCGTDNPDGAKFCKSCGTALLPPAPPTPECQQCHAALTPGARFCKKCGASATTESTAVTATTVTNTTVDAVAPVSSDVSVSETDAPPSQLAPIGNVVAEEAVLAGNLPANADASAIPVTTAPASVIAAATTTPQASASTVKPAAVPSQPAGSDASPAYNALPVSKTATPVKAIVLVAAVLAIAVGAGAYVWYTKSRTQAEPVVTNAEPAAASLPANSPIADVVPAPASDVATPEVTAPQTAPASIETPAPVSAKKKRRNDDDEFEEDEEFYDEPVSGKRHQGSQAQPGGEMMHGKATALLNRADSFIASGDYDNALATAQTALALDPGNTAALAKIRKIKQLRSRY